MEVNAVDTSIRSGGFKTTLPFPFIIGREAMEEVQRYADQMSVWFARGLSEEKIAQQLPLSYAAEAHQLYETRSLFGKLVLVPD